MLQELVLAGGGSRGAGTYTRCFVNVLCVKQRNKQVPRLQCRSQSKADGVSSIDKCFTRLPVMVAFGAAQGL